MKALRTAEMNNKDAVTSSFDVNNINISQRIALVAEVVQSEKEEQLMLKVEELSEFLNDYEECIKI